MKKLLFIPLFLLSIAGYSQMNTFGGVGLRVNDTTTYQTNAAAYHTAGYYDIYFNNQATNDHWDVWNGSSYDHIFAFETGGGTVDGSGTTNEIPYWVNSTTLGSLATATYPSLTELSYVKGLTSSAQTQLGTKWSLANGGTLTGANTITATGTNNLTLNFATLGAANGVTINSNSTDATGDTQTIFHVHQSGTNANSGQATYGIYALNEKAGTTSDNFAIQGLSRSGANTNIGGYFESSSTPSGSTNYGVYAQALSLGSANYGLRGVASNSGNANYGVHAVAGGTGTINYGGYLSAASGSKNYGLHVDNGISIFGDAPASLPTNAIYIEESNLDGGATGQTPSIQMKNSNATQANSGAEYNVSGLSLYSGGTTVLGQVQSSYGTTSAGAPFNLGPGLYTATRTAHPLFFLVNSTNAGVIADTNPAVPYKEVTAFGVGHTLGTSTITGSFGGYSTIFGYQAQGPGAAFGYKAQATNSEATALGPQARANGLATIAIGDAARATAGTWGGNVAEGGGIASGTYGNQIVMGDAAFTNGNINLFIGGGMGMNDDFGIALGTFGSSTAYTSSITTADHQGFLGGYESSSIYFNFPATGLGQQGVGLANDWWIGGPTQASYPHDITVNFTSRLGGTISNGDGIDAYFTGSRGTGTGDPGRLIFQTSETGSTGTTLQSLEQRAVIDDVGIIVGGNATRAGAVRLLEDTDNGTNYTQLQIGTQSADITYTLPTAAPVADGYVMSSTTAGVMSWVSKTGTLHNETTQVGNVGTGEDQLFSYTIPAATLAADGNSITGSFVGTVAANANVKTLKFKFGATTIMTTVVTNSSITSSWSFDYTITRTGATTQKCNIRLHNPDGLGVSYYATAGEALSGTVALVLTGEATANDDIVKQMAKVKFED